MKQDMDTYERTMAFAMAFSFCVCANRKEERKDRFELRIGESDCKYMNEYVGLDACNVYICIYMHVYIHFIYIYTHIHRNMYVCNRF